MGTSSNTALRPVTDMKVIHSLFACADWVLLRAMWVSSNQVRVLLVSLELAVVEQSRV
jgi:hypothetical protein